MINRVSQAGLRNPMLSGLTYAVIVMFALTMLLSMLLYLTSFSEESAATAVILIHIVALLIGGFVSGRRSGERGWYYGGMIGMIYAIIVLLVGYLGYDASLGTDTLVQLLSAFASGAVGGIFGVNAASAR